MLKKILVLAVCMCMISTCTLAATLTMEPSVNQSSVAVNILIDEIPSDIQDISAITIQYTFDSDKLTYLSTNSEICVDNLKTKSGGGYIGWFDTKSEEEDTNKITQEILEENNNILFTINFKANEDATGEAKVQITFAEFADYTIKCSETLQLSDVTIDFGGSNDDGSDNTGSDNTGSDNTGSDDDGSDNTGSDNDGSNDDGSDDDSSDDDRPSRRPSGGVSASPVVKPVVTPQAVQFADIPSGNWAYTYAKNLFDKGIIAGDGSQNPSMRPDANITREEAAKIALLAMGISPDANLTLDFADSVTVSDWAKSYIATAVKHGILKGSNGNVRAKDLITREEMVTILSRAMGWNLEDSSLNFADTSDVSDWSRAAVAYAAQSGILTGYSDNTVKPKATITRAETFALVSRCLSR